MYSRVRTCTLQGLEGHVVDVETDLARALPKFSIVGLPDAAIRESSERVRAAIKNSGFDFPMIRITINLSPASLRKDGTQMDLAIAVSILTAEDGANSRHEDFVFLGELSLDGTLNPILGALPMVIALREKGFKKIVVPYENRMECAVIEDVEIYPAHSLKEVMEYLRGEVEIARERCVHEAMHSDDVHDVDFSDIRGQEQVKRAMEIAAAGGHNLLMIGSPGCGKSMAAKRLPTILPPMTFEEAVEVTKIYSVAGLLEGHQLLTKRPFRAPHHTSSAVSLIGGGSNPRPGEISLSHHGVLYLDELPEFSRHVLEVMRQPMEDHTIHISRANARVEYPANFMLIAAMNPCPCGYFGSTDKECTCSAQSITKYLGKISHPLLDRIDLHIEMRPVSYEKMTASPKEETSADIRARVVKAREIQRARFIDTGILSNSLIPDRLITTYCALDAQGETVMKKAFETYHFSGRSYHKVLKVARTIADLAGEEKIEVPHLLEAIRYRAVEAKYWGATS